MIREAIAEMKEYAEKPDGVVHIHVSKIRSWLSEYTKDIAKLEGVGAILPSSACDSRKLQNIEGVLNGMFRPEYFNNPTHPGD